MLRRFSQAVPRTLRTLTVPVGGGKPKYMRIEDAIKLIQNGDVVYPSNFAGAPADLLKEICNQVDHGRLQNVQIFSAMIEGGVPWADAKYQGKVAADTIFATSSNRKLIQSGRGDYTPMFLSETAKLFRNFKRPLDVAMATISPPNQHGYCSLGVAADCSVDAIRAAKVIIGEETASMPYTVGETEVHISQFDAVVKTNRQILTAPLPSNEHSIDEDAAKIGKMIAEELIDDGATLQIGIGAITDAACSFLKNHRDLGVHSELISDAMVDLVKLNVVTNARKSINPGKCIGALAFGTRQFYDYISNNPFFEFRSASYTNNPSVIQQNHKMTSINACIEIDLAGQIAADSIGTEIYSGIGGQLDFVYGAASAADGKSIMALTSCTSKGDSKIVPFLKQGAGVVTTRGHVQYVVTEYGIANLWGKNLRQRAYELISIAHPKHRESLEKSAFEILKCMPSK